MKYLKFFNTEQEYNDFLNSPEFVRPNLSLVSISKKPYYHSVAKQKADIVATYNTTKANMFAFRNMSNIKQLKIDGRVIENLPEAESHTIIKDIRKEYFNISSDGKVTVTEEGRISFDSPSQLLENTVFPRMIFYPKNGTFESNKINCVFYVFEKEGSSTCLPMPIGTNANYGSIPIGEGALFVYDPDSDVCYFQWYITIMLMAFLGNLIGIALGSVNEETEEISVVDTIIETEISYDFDITNSHSGYAFTEEGEHVVEIMLKKPYIPLGMFTQTCLTTFVCNIDIDSVDCLALGGCFNLKEVTFKKKCNNILEMGLAENPILKKVTINKSYNYSMGSFAVCMSLENIDFISNTRCFSAIMGFVEAVSLPKDIVISEPPQFFDTSVFSGSSIQNITIGEGINVLGIGGTIDKLTLLSDEFPPLSEDAIGVSDCHLYLPPTMNYDGEFSTIWYNELKENNWFVDKGLPLPELNVDNYDVAVILQPCVDGSTQLCNTSGITRLYINGVVTDTANGDEIKTTYNFNAAYNYEIVKFKLTDNIIPKNMFQNTRIIKVIINEGITEIGENAFAYCYGLKEILLPKSLSIINKGAFTGCKRLKNIILPEGLLKIDENTFKGCIDLESVYFPESLISIGKSAFDTCSSLKEINIPSLVMDINNTAFNYCNNIDTIKVNTDNIYYTSNNGSNCLIEISTNTLLKGSKNSIIPPITKIGDYAFQGFTSLTSLVIPEGVESIGVSAFNACLKLQHLSLPTTLKTISKTSFCGCISLEEIIIPNSVTLIDAEAFDHCISLKKIVLPETITAINKSVFEMCFNLQEINIPNTVTTIDALAFNSCINLGGTLEIPSSVTSIGDSAFGNCGYSEIILPDSITVINDSTFSNCTNLENFIVPSSVVSIGASAFSSCTNLKHITLNNNITSIGQKAFNACSSLEEIEIPNSVTSIESETFSGCTKLASITIPNSITTIGASSFYDCVELKTITIPNSVTTIGNASFRGCKKLELLEIGENVTTIDAFAFADTVSLNTIIAHPKTVPTGTQIFENTGQNGILFTPYDSDYSTWMDTLSGYGWENKTITE